MAYWREIRETEAAIRRLEFEALVLAQRTREVSVHINFDAGPEDPRNAMNRLDVAADSFRPSTPAPPPAPPSLKPRCKR